MPNLIHPIEIDISTGHLIFEWASLDHVDPSESVLPISPGQAGSGYNSSDAWDYFHINSVDKNAEGDYLISARDACSIHKINGTSGEIIWRLNGKRSDFKVAKKAEFCFQHHARWLPSSDPNIELVSLYDNSAHGTEHGEGRQVHTAPFSSGKILKLDTVKWTAELVQGYYPPEGYKLLSKSQGSTQVLPNGNALINWGSDGAVTEYSVEGKPIFHAYMDSGDLGEGVENYRGFRYNWTGLPTEEPAVVALEREDSGKTTTTVYVSWNGDTETAVWRFYEVADGFGSRDFLGESKRTSFETKLVVPYRKGKKVGKVSAEAVDRAGRVLRVTGVAGVEKEVLPASARPGGSGGDQRNSQSREESGDEQKVLVTGASKSRWEDHAILKGFRFGKDL